MLIFDAKKILAKHDENYTPPEVADAMNEAYQRKQEALSEQSYKEPHDGKELTRESKYYMDSTE